MPDKVIIEGDAIDDLRQLLEYVAESEHDHFQELTASVGPEATARHVYVYAVRLQRLLLGNEQHD